MRLRRPALSLALSCAALGGGLGVGATAPASASAAAVCHGVGTMLTTTPLNYTTMRTTTFTASSTNPACTFTGQLTMATCSGGFLPGPLYVSLTPVDPTRCNVGGPGETHFFYAV